MNSLNVSRFPNVSHVSRKQTKSMRGGALKAPLSNVSRFPHYIGKHCLGNIVKATGGPPNGSYSRERAQTGDTV